MNKGFLAIVALLVIAGIAYFAAAPKESIAPLVSAKELENALNKQLQTITTNDEGLQIIGHFNCDSKLVCVSEKLVGRNADMDLFYFDNFRINYVFTEQSSTLKMDTNMSFASGFLEMIEFENPGATEVMTPFLPSKLACNSHSILDSQIGIEASKGDCTFFTPSADWTFTFDGDIAFELFKNITMPELILDRNGKIARALQDENIEAFDSLQFGLRNLTIELHSHNFGDALFEALRLSNKEVSRNDVMLGLDMMIGMGIMTLRANEIDEEDAQTSQQFAAAFENLQIGLHKLLKPNSEIKTLNIALNAKDSSTTKLYSLPMLAMGSIYEILRYYRLDVSYQ